MRTRGPSAAQIIVALAFALSCFGLALFLWVTFGGPIPLQAEGYRFHVDFNEATQLAQQSDVRISGVSAVHVTVKKKNKRPQTTALRKQGIIEQTQQTKHRTETRNHTASR